MMHEMLSPPPTSKPTVHVEPCRDGGKPRMMVRVVFNYDGGMQENEHLFDTLDEALAYARYVCSDED
jgi:hypothetical protein